MKIKADLHTHTTYSDGALPPKLLLDLAHSRQISFIGITDHDTVAGIDEAIKYGKKIGIEVIPGVEISTDIEGTEIHILGYFIDYKDKELNNVLKFFRDERIERAKRIIKKLNKLNIEITLEDVHEFSQNAPICRPHIAKALFKKGYIKNYMQAFQKYIGDDGPAFERKIHVSPQSAIKIINDAGGLSFIAHPGNMKDTILKNLINLGIDGIEVIHSSHKKYLQKYYTDIVNQYCLLASGGSDFHGGFRNDETNMGKYYITETFLSNLKNASKLNSRK